ncbi:MAG: Endonuclease III, partial [uncultured Solirubrobacteraceae bacterium]
GREPTDARRSGSLRRPRHSGPAGRLAAARRSSGPRAARPSPARLRHSPGGAAPASRRRADPHRALAVDQRSQPRRGVPQAARSPAHLGGGARRAAAGGRGGDPPRRHLARQVRAHPGHPARPAGSGVARRPGGDAGGRRARSALRSAGRRAQDRGLRAAVLLRHARRAGGHARLPGGDAPRPAAARSAVRGAPRRAAGDDSARPGARAARQSPAPRAAHVSRPATRLRAVRAAAHVPERSSRRL